MDSIRSASAINPVTMENMDDSHLQRLRSHASHYCELTPWAVGKKKWETNKDKGKSKMHALYVLQYAKRYISRRNDVEV